jgi:hypothetical protein
MSTDFQPTMLGMTVHFQDEGSGMITNETPTAIFIESDFFTGWMLKTEYYELLGVEE